MANRVRSFRPAGGRTQRRQSDWLSFSLGIDSLDTSGVVLISSLGASALALRPFTVVRTHLELYMISDQQSASEAQLGAFGCCVVSDQASAIGVTAVPTPITDIGSDLFYAHQVMFNSFGFGSAVGLVQEGTRYTIDSKAMRKVSSDQDIVFTMEAAGSSSGFSVFTGGRLLVKLH